jgi:hypothetical protein
MIDRLPEDAATLYAETLAVLLAREQVRDWSHLSGGFSFKAIKGTDYVYFQYSDPGGVRRQFCVGRRDANLDQLVAEYSAGREVRLHELDRVVRLSGLLRAAGVAMTPHGPARVLRALSDAGVFAAGGVLMGSYAFLLLANMLSLRWPGATWRTQDVDVAAHVQIALPNVEADIPSALDALKMGFVPIPDFDPRNPSTSFHVRGGQLRVDVLTPGGDQDVKPIAIPRFRTAASPIKWLSLAMHEAQPAVAIEGANTTLVMVPSPARYALHKLLVSQTRSVTQQTKSGKDLHQAALLLEALAEDRPEDLEIAAAAFAESGPAVAKKALRGLAAAIRRWPECATARELVQPVLESAS